jgi:hypothetical protein
MPFKAPTVPANDQEPTYPLRIASPRISRADSAWEDFFRPHPDYTVWRTRLALVASVLFLATAILTLVLPDHALFSRLASAATVAYLLICYFVIKRDVARISALTGPQSLEIRTVEAGMSMHPDFRRLYAGANGARELSIAHPDSSDATALEDDSQLTLWQAAGCSLEIPGVNDHISDWLLAEADALEQRLATTRAAVES